MQLICLTIYIFYAINSRHTSFSREAAVWRVRVRASDWVGVRMASSMPAISVHQFARSKSCGRWFAFLNEHVLQDYRVSEVRYRNVSTVAIHWEFCHLHTFRSQNQHQTLFLVLENSRQTKERWANNTHLNCDKSLWRNWLIGRMKSVSKNT